VPRTLVGLEFSLLLVNFCTVLESFRRGILTSILDQSVGFSLDEDEYGGP